MSAPRWSLAVLSLVHAPVFALSARFLPWTTFSVFAGFALLIAVLHTCLLVLAVMGSSARVRVLRFTAWVVLGFLGYITYAALSSGLYLANLYSGVGLPLAGAAAAAWCVVALFTLPFGLWGIAKTGGLRLSRAVPLSSAIFLVTVAFAVSFQAGSARGEATLAPEMTRETIRAALQARLASLAHPRPMRASIFSPSPADCPAPPSPGKVTLLASYRHTGDVAAVVCVEGPELDRAMDNLASALEKDYLDGPVSIDVVRRAQPLGDLGLLMGALSLRPADDGVCNEARCLAPFQLVGIDAFTQLSAVSTFDVKLGLSAPSLRKALGAPNGGFEGLVRIETESFVVLPNGDVEPLRRLRPKAEPLSSASLARSMRAAGAFIVHAQEHDGRFHYSTDPFTGATSMSGFGIPRQAGTTVSLCDARAFIPEAEGVAVRSLGFLTSLEVKEGEMSGMGFRATDPQPTWLGSSALTMVAFLACRNVVGTRFDGVIDRLGRGILASQKPDGSFAPRFDVHARAPVDGKRQLYADGQAILALVMWEAAKTPGLDRPKSLGEHIDAAMDYVGGLYWNGPLHDLFFLEENWHCLAAREALKSHRRDGYERFCLDYMKMKTKLMIEEGDTNDPDFIGGYGFGTLIPPHNAATGGFAESLAAAVDIERARGIDATADEARVNSVLEYLLRHQWTEDGCFFCTDRTPIAGAFSENIGSPYIRIDFLQHTLAALNHAGVTVGLVDAIGGG